MSANKKQYRKAKFMQRFVNGLTSLQKRNKPKEYTERYVDTSNGFIRVLEYGFNTEKTAPLFIDMHGGGFVLMTADSDNDINSYLLKNTDVKIISIDYPKAPDYPFPIPHEAVYEVILYYKNHAEEFALDALSFGIGGHSAGANLATVICIKAKERGDLHINYQILDYPPLDLDTDPDLKPKLSNTVPPKMARMFNECYAGDKAKTPLVSPVFAPKEMLEGLPPAMIIVAGLDSLKEEGIKYSKMLKAAGVEVKLHEFKDAEHGFTLNKSEDTDNALELMVDFINKHI